MERSDQEELGDEELLGAYVRGDTSALAVLVGRYRRMLYGTINQMVGNSQDSDEIFQEVWMKVIRNAAEYRKGNFRGWLFQLTRNLVVDRLRRAKNHISIDAEVEGMEGVRLRDCMADDRVTPEVEAGRRDMAVLVGEAVSALPAEQREVFLMRMNAECSFREIARLQKVSINTVLARMQYAVASLRKRLGKIALKGELQ